MQYLFFLEKRMQIHHSSAWFKGAFYAHPEKNMISVPILPQMSLDRTLTCPFQKDLNIETKCQHWTLEKNSLHASNF